MINSTPLPAVTKLYTYRKPATLPINILWMIQIGKMLSPHKKQKGFLFPLPVPVMSCHGGEDSHIIQYGEI